ncbi:hypothetical protein K2173_012300 [Erythroxylum novogranatense]|uniref:Uncharacterized protein n=1 Tax=Erythroxylum novogranatense TaxID=1862640 RepID=A0AAV8SCH7_9ROSI|nr:hypothetical protein K2173_012300 [Erythroxylum novogranatense]
MLHWMLILVSILSFTSTSPTLRNRVNGEVLNVGEELWEETLSLQMSSRIYLLQGLKPFTWYEVKISYPASIPTRFALQLKKDNSDSRFNLSRKLLNTEKLIFKTDSLSSDQSKLYVMVTVEPEGFVAIPHVQERKDVIFNIVCDELLVGIPHKAWFVAFLALLCLVLALVIPRFLPSYLLLLNGRLGILNHNIPKEC